jgi:spore maturation protein CgeB
MKIVVFGLTVSSSWGNGHATLWRGLCKALKRKGCRVVLVAAGAADAIAAIDTGEGDLARIGRAGRERTLDEHTCDHRARALMAALELARTSARVRQTAEA